MSITTTDRTSVGIIQHAAGDCLRVLATELGLSFVQKGGSFDARGTYSFRCEFKLKEIGGVPLAQIEFNRYCRAFGLEERDFGAVITANREQWKLVGIAIKRPKYPLLFERLSDGKATLFTADLVDRVVAARKQTVAIPDGAAQTKAE